MVVVEAVAFQAVEVLIETRNHVLLLVLGMAKVEDKAVEGTGNHV